MNLGEPFVPLRVAKDHRVHIIQVPQARSAPQDCISDPSISLVGG